MVKDFLQDRAFLLKVSKYHIREYIAKISILDFTSETVISSIVGKVVSGSMSINAKSPTRRTGSLQVVFDETTKDITDTLNLIAIDKKISISIGYKNPLYFDPEYRIYGEELLYKQGVFIITNASSSITTTSCSVTVQFVDKMGLLNGTAGGVLPASVSFHESIIIDKDGNQTTQYPLIENIIREAVNHFGGEHPSKIIIEGVPKVGRQVVAWGGDTPIYFQNFSKGGTSFIITNGVPDQEDYPNRFVKGDIIGYKETDLTYPGELVQKAGASVQQVLDSIAKTLGNYEYFYDVDGNFHFQTIANYNKTGDTNLVPTGENSLTSNSNFQMQYLQQFNDDQFIDDFADKSNIISLNYNPQYANIKNDWVCWGTRQDKSSSSSSSSSTTSTAKMVRYHLAIDERPKDSETALCYLPYRVKYNKEDKTIIAYVFAYRDGTNFAWDGLKDGEEWEKDDNNNVITHSQLDFFDWREELYRMALNAYKDSVKATYYDEELMAEWRNIFDIDNEEFKDKWEDVYGENTFRGYTPDVNRSPEKLRYWLDFIDSSAPIGQYSVNKIGRRTNAWEDSQINEVYAREINDIVFVTNPGVADETESIINYYAQQGQNYCFIQPDMENNLTYKNSYGTCFEAVRQKMNENLNYNATLSITCIPLLYLDVNKIIRVNYPENGICGDFVINTLSWQIGYNSTMTISCNEAITTI